MTEFSKQVERPAPDVEDTCTQGAACEIALCGIQDASSAGDTTGYAVQDGLLSRSVSRRTFVTVATGIGAAAVVSCSALGGFGVGRPEEAFASERPGSRWRDGEDALDADGAFEPTASGEADQPVASYGVDASASCGVDASALSAGADFDSYPVFYDGAERDEYGFTILTGAAAGCQLKEGMPYRVRRGIVNLAPSGNAAGLVARNNLICVDEGATLLAFGNDAVGPQFSTRPAPGTPGIALPADSSLCFVGKGAVRAYGGNAGNGAGGANGGSGDSQKDHGGHYQGGTGGAGGAGGPGAGAGIGTVGSLGGAGGAEVVGPYRKHNKTETGGNDGNAGSGATIAPEEGCLCVAGSVSVLAHGGDFGKGGTGGGHGNNDKSKYFWRVYNAGYGGGGGGGGGGSVANGIGRGGTGGMGGSSGGSGGLCYRNAPFHDAAPQGEGGTGGFRGAASGKLGEGAPNRDAGRGDRGQGDWTHEYKPGGHTKPLSASNSPCPTYPDKGKLFAIRGDGTHPSPSIKGSAWDGSELDGFVSWVDAYTGLSDVPHNGAWYVRNVVSNQRGDGEQHASLPTIMALTTEEEITRQLRDLGKLVPKREGYTFLGWSFTDHSHKVEKHLVYDATKDSFDLAPLRSNYILGAEGSEFAGKWMACYPATFSAEWAAESLPETCTVLYLPNGSTFVDAAGRTVAEYRQEDCPIGKTYTLWDGKTTYTVRPPEGIDADDFELQWRFRKADGSESDFDPGASFYLNAKAGETLTYNAVWVEREDDDDEVPYSQVSSRRGARLSSSGASDRRLK